MCKRNTIHFLIPDVVDIVVELKEIFEFLILKDFKREFEAEFNSSLFEGCDFQVTAGLII